MQKITRRTSDPGRTSKRSSFLLLWLVLLVTFLDAAFYFKISAVDSCPFVRIPAQARLDGGPSQIHVRELYSNLNHIRVRRFILVARQRRALLFLPPADLSPISGGGDSHVSDFSNHCRGFVDGVRGDRYFVRTGSTAPWEKFVFPRGLRCDMQQAWHRQKLQPVLRERYGAQRVPLNFAQAARGAGCLSAGASIVSGRCPWFLAKWFHAD